MTEERTEGIGDMWNFKRRRCKPAPTENMLLIKIWASASKHKVKLKIKASYR